ncbi:RNA polymerase subunit sigma-24 [Anaeromicrobium sediminis]|uniref:RNA polymerase subunit sigma-24 n=1 Tax=Anaeromicrobium sediminis TaxID=1478221 RepID=A0A267MP82_9FIRM|nr:RNA polymerase subunit sigma-24 [Anaeromicrobium sediminis]
MGVLDIEKSLIKKCQSGDVESFELLIKDYEKRAFNIAYRMLGNVEDANDATQEAFIKIYKHINKFKGDSSFSTWLYRIVTNTCLDILRKNKNKKTLSYDNPTETEEGTIKREFVDHKTNTEKTVEREMVKKELHECINSLGDSHKTAIILRDINGFSYKEIAHILSCSEGTVKSKINRARKNLKNLLEDKMELFKDQMV